MNILDVHLFLKEYGLTIAIFLLALAVIFQLFDKAIQYHEQDKREAERRYSKGALNENNLGLISGKLKPWSGQV